MKAELVELTKAGILNNLSEEDIFARYLGVATVNEDDFYLNPLRSDRTPGCRFFRRATDNRLLFNDWAWRTFDCFDFVMLMYGLTFHQALLKIATDFNLISNNQTTTTTYKLKTYNKAVEKKKLLLKVKRRNFLPEELAFWNIGRLEVDEELLRSNKIYAISSFWEFRGDKQIGHYTKQIMTFAYHFGGYNYQIYRPKQSRSKRRFINSPDIKVGDLEFLDRSANHVLLTKSKKDAFFLRLLGVNSIFLITERVRPYPELLTAIQDYPLKLTLFDNDFTGRRLSILYKEHGFIPLLYPKDYGKDTYDTLKNYDKYFMLDLIEEVKTYYL